MPRASSASLREELKLRPHVSSRMTVTAASIEALDIMRASARAWLSTLIVRRNVVSPGTASGAASEAGLTSTMPLLLAYPIIDERPLLVVGPT